MHKKIVFLDVDNVLLDWSYGFWKWVTKHGYTSKPFEVVSDIQNYNSAIYFEWDDEQMMHHITEFNSSSDFAKLGPMSGAIRAVKELYEAGMAIRIVTAPGTGSHIQASRRENLLSVFGDVFDEIDFVDLSHTKEHLIEPFRDSGCAFVEENIRHAKKAEEMGLMPYVLAAGYNSVYKGLPYSIQRGDWPTIVDWIIGENRRIVH